MSLILGYGILISEVDIDNFFSLEQRNKNKYDMQDAVYNESKSNSDNNDDNNNYNDNSKHDNKNYNSDNDNDGNGNGNNNSKCDANNVDDNHNYNNSNNEDEIDSFILGTAVNNILNSMPFYNKPEKDVLDNYDVNHELECLLSLVNIEIKSYQELNLVEYDMFYQSENSILGCSKLSENIQNEPNIPFNSKYIKSESNVTDINKVGPCKVNKFELESEYIKSEYMP